MALSNSYDFTVTRNDIIRDALLEIGAIDAYQTIDALVITDVSRQLNMMLKYFQNEYNLWRFKEITITLDGSQSYTIGPAGADVTDQRPMRITHARRSDGTNEIPVDVVSLQEYKDQPLKSSTGQIVMCAYDPQLTTGVLYVWGAQSSGSLIVTALMPIMDVDTASDNLQIPAEWIMTVVTNLAVRIAPQFPGSMLTQMTIETANRTLNALRSFDSETASIYIQPERV